MTDPTPAIRMKLDPCNPGQFFACCGLLELADRLWDGAEGWFASRGSEFYLAPVTGAGSSLGQLLRTLLATDFQAIDAEDLATSPLLLGASFHLRLDWWKDEAAGGSELKTWAGRQQVVTIARAMRQAFARALQWASESGRELERDLLQYSEVIPDPTDPKRSVAPFYFDARRAAGASNIDIGFSPDVQQIDATSFPAVEFLCLVGLQRFRPARDPKARKYLFNAWSWPLLPAAACAAVAGVPADYAGRRYEFRLLFRTKYLKGFLPANLWRPADE